MAATFCNTPFAAITLIEEDRVWNKSLLGIEIKEGKRDVAFSSTAILNPTEPLVIKDASRDDRFRHNPHVTGEPGIRFYAGFQLLSSENIPIGVLSVMDREPRDLNAKERDFLIRLSGVVMDRIERERQRYRLENLLGQEHLFYQELLSVSSGMRMGGLTLHGILENLTMHIDPNLGWFSVRTTGYDNGRETICRNSSKTLDEEKIRDIWDWIDRSQPAGEETGGLHLITPDHSNENYYLLCTPVFIRNKRIAVLEMIYPEDAGVDERIRKMMELLTNHLGVIAERELLLTDANHRACHDDLTGAAGRSLILSEVGRSIEACDPLRPDTVLLFFDLDGFKEVNDSFGHETGDRLLKEVTSRLMGVCRDGDMLGRLSGDEFVLLARGLDIDTGLPPLLERILRHLDAPYMLGDLEIRVHASVGCTVIDRSGVNPSEILRLAEEAMYLVKSGQHQGFCIADEHMINESAKRRNLEKKVKQALRNGGPIPVFQPIIDLKTGNLCGSETLMRLKCRDGSVMTAGEFMPLIQGSRFLIRLDELALAETICHFRTDAGRRLLSMEGFRFTVNASSASLFTKGYAEHSLHLLSEASISPSSMVIEITETTVLPTDESVIRNLRQLRENGVQIALDDFGSGYSNLLQLVNFPVDIIKIDQSFIQGIAQGDLTKNSLLGAIMGIGKSLGYEIYAEGVEDEIQATYLKSLGCFKAQGFYFARPMPFEEMIAWSANPKIAVTASSGEHPPMVTKWTQQAPVRTS
jgi:diguanylate cyclase (GGDEF)-like protein